MLWSTSTSKRTTFRRKPVTSSSSLTPLQGWLLHDSSILGGVNMHYAVLRQRLGQRSGQRLGQRFGSWLACIETRVSDEVHIIEMRRPCTSMVG